MHHFDETWAESVISALAERDVDVSTGLSTDDLKEIGDAFGTALPNELALVLRVGVPVSPKWAKWKDGPEVVATETREWLHRAFAFDIEHGYWHEHLGHHPADTKHAIAQAQEVIDRAPPLIPIYAHRFLATEPATGTRAVLSVWQAVDSIFYGNDLADYFAREFGIDRPSWAADKPPSVPVWQDLFDLFGLDE